MQNKAQKDRSILFQQVGSDDNYEMVRSGKGKDGADVRRYCEGLYEKNKEYVDKDFHKKFQNDFISCMWELILADWINRQGLRCTVRNKDGGPDFRILNDQSGEIYLIGITTSIDFPTTPNVYDNSYNDIYGPTWDLFVLKLNQNGSGLIYSTYIGGKFWEVGSDSDLDQEGNIYVIGHTNSSNFPNTTNAYDRSHNGRLDVFLFKLNHNGSKLLYSTYFGGFEDDVCSDSSIDPDGNIYVTGITNSANFPNTTGAYDTTFNGDVYNYDAFVFKFNTLPLSYS